VDKIIGGLAILAALVGVADAPLRRLMFTIAGVGALVLVGLGIYEIVPKAEIPYQFLSMTCNNGRRAPSSGYDVYPYVILGDEISAGVTPSYFRSTAATSPYFATCLLRNEGAGPVYNVQIAFAYLGLSLRGPAHNAVDMRRGKVKWVTIPHVGTNGAYLIFQSEVQKVAFLAPTYSCRLENPLLGRPQSCRLPPLDQWATSFVTQVPVAVFPGPLGH
jgi:hypothetical protein